MGKVNAVNPRGDDFTINLSFKDSNGDAVNISSYEIKCTLKADKSLSDTDSGVITADGVIDSGADGTAHVTFPASVTANLTGSYFYDVQSKDGNGIIKTVVDGIITFTEDVTIRTT